MKSIAGHGIVRRRQVEEPRRHLERVAIAVGHDRGTGRIIGEPVGAHVPRMRLTGAVAHHRPRRIKRDAPAVLLQCEGGGELDEDNRGDRRANGGLAEEGRMQPEKRRRDQADEQRFRERVERRAIKPAAQVAGPHQGDERDDAPHETDAVYPTRTGPTEGVRLQPRLRRMTAASRSIHVLDDRFDRPRAIRLQLRDGIAFDVHHDAAVDRRGRRLGDIAEIERSCEQIPAMRFRQVKSPSRRSGIEIPPQKYRGQRLDLDEVIGHVAERHRIEVKRRAMAMRAEVVLQERDKLDRRRRDGHERPDAPRHARPIAAARQSRRRR